MWAWRAPIPLFVNTSTLESIHPQRHSQSGFQPRKGGDVGIRRSGQDTADGALINSAQCGSLAAAESLFAHRIGKGLDKHSRPNRFHWCFWLHLTDRPFLVVPQPLGWRPRAGSEHTQMVRVSIYKTQMPHSLASTGSLAKYSDFYTAMNYMTVIYPFPPYLGVNASQWWSCSYTRPQDGARTRTAPAHDLAPMAGGIR